MSLTFGRKHLAELNYPAPRTVSKLEDQVSVMATRNPWILADMYTGLRVLSDLACMLGSRRIWVRSCIYPNTSMLL